MLFKYLLMFCYENKVVILMQPRLGLLSFLLQSRSCLNVFFFFHSSASCFGNLGVGIEFRDDKIANQVF